MADSTALCAEHSAPAMGACERCGTFVCEQCGFREREHLRCFKCGAPEAEKAPPLAFTALLVAALGLMCPPLSLIGLALALAARAGESGRTNLGAQYVRWALVVGAMSLVVGGALYAFVAWTVWAIAPGPR